MKIATIVLLLTTSCMAKGQVLESRTFSTEGHPTQAIATPDEKYVLVTVNRKDGDVSSSAIEVFAVEGGQFNKVAVQPLGTEGAQGIALLAGTKPLMLAVGLSNAGVAFLPLEQTLAGKATVQLLPQGAHPLTGHLAVSPDGNFLFASNEFANDGSIGVIALHKDAAGAIHPATLGQIPTPSTTPSVSISPDGTLVLTEGEVLPPGVAERLPGLGTPELQRSDCSQGAGKPSQGTGGLYVVDAAKAEAITPATPPQQAQEAIRTTVSAGCSPVRAVFSPDGRLVYVTARGDNKVLVFDAKLLASKPAKAFLRAFSSGGTAPVGIKFFDGGRKLIVANSNRSSPGVPGKAVVFDVSDPASPKLVQTIRTGEYPRNITSSPDGKTLYLTVFSSDQVMVLLQK